MNKDLERQFDRAMISMGNKGTLMKIGTLQGKGIAVRGNYATTSETG